jgi:protein-tyrosine-phosphatase
VAAVAPLSVLVLCTMNQCRSPMAASLLRERALDLGLELDIASAGFGPSGHPAHPGALRVMADRRFPLDGHVSRRVDGALLAGADLVVTMERRHVQEVAALHHDAWPHTFPLLDLVERASRRLPRQPDEPLADWVASLHAGRRAGDLLDHRGRHDVEDPTGGPKRGYAATRDELDRLGEQLLRMAAGQGPAQTGAPRRRGSWFGLRG